MRKKTVAFIGAGNMGSPMARCARRAGFELIICDRNQTVLNTFADEGVRVTMDAVECADADVIIVLLANDAQIMDVMLGDNGLVKAIPSRKRPIVCMMSTTLPETLQVLQSEFNDAGCRLVDAPVSGGIVGAENGTLTIMLGGDSDDVNEVMPLMQSMGEHIFHCGELGTAEVVKVINNMLCVTNMFLTAEAIDLARKYGVSFETLSSILAVSTGLNFLTKDASVGKAQYRAWARSEEAFQAIKNVVSKDLKLAINLAEHVSLDLGLLEKVSHYVSSEDTEVMDRWMRSGGIR